MPFRIRSILAANDRSEAADKVVRAAADLAVLTAAELHVVHALELPSPQPDIGVAVVGVDAALEEAREAQRQELRYSIPPTILVDSCEVGFGRPQTVILQRAAEVEADLIVIGPHRPHRLADRVLGTTADRVIRTSEAPCLIVRAPLTLPLRRILVASDLSSSAQRALEVALTWGGALRMPTERGGGTTLSVLHLLERGEAGRLASAEAELQAQIAAAAKATGIGKLLELHAEVRETDSPAEEILHTARAQEIDLLVLGTHGRSALDRALIGSVSSNVARQAETPLLLVPPIEGD
jgi:nucleotide-binding universal stress UspA family protein